MKKNLFELMRVRSWMLAIALLPALSSCLNSNDAPDPSTPASYASFYHGSPDAGGLDILLDGTKINSAALAYGNYTGYATFSPGVNKLRFTSTGSSTGLVDITPTFTEGRLYSIFIINTLSSLETLVVKDSSATLSSTGRAGVRLVHLSPDAPAVNIYTSGTDGKLLFGNREFKTATNFMEIDANVYSLDIKTTDGTKLATVENITFSTGRFYTLVVRGFATPPTGNSNTLTLQSLVNQ